MEERFKNIFNRKFFLHGAILFFIFTLIGLLTGSLWKGSRNVSDILRFVHWNFFGIMFLLMFIDWVLMGYRVFIFAANMSNRVRFWDCFRANLVNTCVGAITPSQTGGAVGQIYILYRSEVPLAGGATISIITFLATLIVLFFSTLFVIAFHPRLYTGEMSRLTQYCFIMFGLVLSGTILLLSKPDVVLGLISKFSSSRIIKLNPRIYKFSRNAVAKLKRITSDYKEYTKFFIKRKKGMVLLGVVVTFIIYLNKFAIAYVITRALEGKTSFWDVISIQILMIFIGYFLPTPGGSGISEFSTTLFMAPLMRQGMAPYFTAIWRFSNTYLELLIGGVIIISQLRRDIHHS